MKYLDPRADLTFKRVFGEHPDLVMSLLNALLPLAPGEEITDIEYLPSEMIPENPLRKYGIVDVRCKDKLGRQFLVTLQVIWSQEFKYRIFFNSSKACVTPLKHREEYNQTEKVYSLNLSNELIEPELKGYYHYYSAVYLEHSDEIIKGQELIFIELPKFNPHISTEKKMQILWLRYLTEINSRTETIPEDLLANPEINKAIAELEVYSFSEAQLMSYERFWDMNNVEKMIIRAGKNKGKAEGLEKGIAKGKAEEQRLIAANLKKQGVHIEMIAKCTGLSVAEIEQL